MLDHVSIPVADLARAGAFYDAVLATLELRRVKQSPSAIGYGSQSQPSAGLWLLQRKDRNAASAGLGLHLSFQAATRAAVDAFHAAALRAGGTDAGAPGPRPEYTQPFYGAFVLDLDGFKIEAVCRAP